MGTSCNMSGKAQGDEAIQARENQKKRLKDFKEVFDLFDSDGGGSIGEDELLSVFNALGVPKTLQEVQAVVQEVDDDGSGEIEFDEFVKIMEGDKKQLTEDELKSEFMNMTTMTLPDEGSGKPEVITIMNMRAIADLLGEEKTDEELQEMLDELDVDKEGCVGWREFKTMVRKAREWGI